MSSEQIQNRLNLAKKIRNSKQLVAQRVTEEFFHHPDWLDKYEERGRQIGIEDACFHIDFLAGAIEGGSPDSFQEYVLWTRRVLEARHITPNFLAENLKQIEHSLLMGLCSEEQEIISYYIAIGYSACNQVYKPLSEDVGIKDIELVRNLFLQAILTGQRKAALGIVKEALHSGYTLIDIYVEVLQESLYGVGRLWEINQITVANEHLATAITQYVVAQLYQEIEPRNQPLGKLLITGVQGELHQVGANIVADFIETNGWDVRFLGSNMPHKGILEIIEKFQPNVLGISTTMLFNLPQVVELVESVHQKFKLDSPKIILGGAAFRYAPLLSTEIGAAGVASDLRGALSLLS